MPKIFDPTKHFAQARLFSTRSEFARGAASSYQMLYRHGLLDEACSHMSISPVYSLVRWTPESVFREAAKYRSRSEFKRECSGAHGYARANGLLDQACAHMRDGHNFWHVFELMAVAIRYNSKSEFIRSEPSAYFWCKTHGLIDFACAHMDKRRDWSSKDDVLAEALKHQSKGAFQASASGAYKQADAGGYLDEACSHMPPPEYGFSKEKAANLYFLRITVPGVGDLYKIGITNRDPLARVAGMGLNSGVTAEVIEVVAFKNGRDARIAEKRLHRKFSSHRYGGLQVMKNGNTELFTVNVLEHSGDI